MSNIQLLIPKFINKITRSQDLQELGLFYKIILPNHDTYNAEIQV